MNRLYRPQFVVPKIQQTSFRDPEAMAELSELLRLLIGGSLIGECQIPLGQYNNCQYSLVPFARPSKSLTRQEFTTSKWT